MAAGLAGLCCVAMGFSGVLLLLLQPALSESGLMGCQMAGSLVVHC